jgi:hypothetical protein
MWNRRNASVSDYHLKSISGGANGDLVQPTHFGEVLRLRAPLTTFEFDPLPIIYAGSRCTKRVPDAVTFTKFPADTYGGR